MQFFLYQILRGLKFVHSAKILHRDLKPRNLLINSNCDLKICDFGLARPCISNLEVSAPHMTDYVATRWYRAPEVLLSYKNYTAAMDMWSVGCIFAELLLRKPLFPGDNTKNQLDLILNLLGTPDEEYIQSISSVKAKEKILKFAQRQGKDFAEVFPEANPEALDLLRKLLVFCPEKRIGVEEALEHPYLNSFHFQEDEPTANPVSMFDFEFESQVLTLKDLKDYIYNEILIYHFQDIQTKYLREKEVYQKE